MLQLVEKIKALFQSVREKGLFHLLSANLFLQVAGFASQFFVTGILSSVDIGRVKILQSIIQIAVIIFGLGLNSSVLKLCSENHEEEHTDRIYLNGLILTLMSTAIGYCILIFFSNLGLLSSDVRVNELMWIYGLLLIPMTINVYQSNYLQAIKRIKEISRIQVITKSITIVLVIVFTYYYGIIGFCVSTLLGFTLTTGVLTHAINSFAKLRLYEIREIFEKVLDHVHYAFYSLWANGFAQLAMIMDVLILNYVSQDREIIGQYAFAITIVMSANILLSTIQHITAPYFSGMQDAPERLLKSFHKYQKVLFPTVIIFPVVLVVFSNLFVPLVFEDKFIVALVFLPYLLIEWSFRGLYTLKFIALWGAGYVKYSSLINLTHVLLSLPIYFYGYYFFGIWGVVLGRIVCTMIKYVLSGFVFHFTIGRTNVR